MEEEEFKKLEGITEGYMGIEGSKDITRNKEASIEWFRDLGFGLFISWEPSSQVGAEMSWPLVGSSKEFQDKYYSLYKTFNPTKFNPIEWAALAKQAGIKYIVFTTQHFNGFNMFDTAFSDFNIMNTPYRKDITDQLARAFRKEDIAIGWYYGVSNWHYYYETDMPEIYGSYDTSVNLEKYKKPYGPQRKTLLECELGQMKELLTQYGHIDIMWFDTSPRSAKPLKELCWNLQPDIFIDRSEIVTPEQCVPEDPPKEVWESCMTMEWQWGYQPFAEYVSTKEIINNLIKIRAGGGNLLINVGPKPDGELPNSQVEILRDLGLWNMINEEAIYKVRRWVITNERNIWFTKKCDEDTVYAFVTPSWEWNKPKTFNLKSVKATKDTTIRVLGQSKEFKWQQDSKGLHFTAIKDQTIRMYKNPKFNNKKEEWPITWGPDWPVAIKITHVKST
jgi:alpha-L-fucosidase